MDGSAPLFNTNVWASPAKEKETGRRPSRPNTSHGYAPYIYSDSIPPELPVTSRADKDNKDRDRDRKTSFGRRASFSSSPLKGKRRQSLFAANGPPFVSDLPPALPDLSVLTAVRRDTDLAVQSPTSADSFSRMLSRNPSIPPEGYGVPKVPPSVPSTTSLPLESNVIYQHIQEMANKRISTLDYLRKAHDGRVYWFNTLLFDKPDLVRMPYFDPRKLERRATNYLLLGLSLPTVIDLNSGIPLEFLRSLNTLFTEFESFQQIHTEHGTNASSLSRARIPQMFRRGPGGKGRRTSGAGDLGLHSDGGAGGAMGNGGANQTPTSVISFGLGSEGNDLLPGEEYTHLLTPSLPFAPDFFETFATLCDMLIDCYTKLMSMIPSSRECTPVVAELFTKVDSKIRKIIIQGVVKEFEDSSRVGLKQEVGNVGKVVLGGLM